ncbi:hypothetical protein G5C60_22675 [Streptomyces sp. HC44]|uniref:FAD-binding domain-containing protein n=1 Tax=Streptomyces scabichelini TaxID=2711217 RepID=A0A6G4V8C4_9ACTN|nr:FAD-dependent monooxygenase [Streptomyces scabichelini]NGO10319.1 hypothetical protein [Streptomyces scabichelini]
MLIADRFQDGRVLLVGESAHMNPPWGGHGCDTCVGDAANIAWKTAAVTDAWQAIPHGSSIDFTSEDRARFMYGPEGTHDPAVLKAAEPACAPIPVDELYEVIEG